MPRKPRNIQKLTQKIVDDLRAEAMTSGEARAVWDSVITGFGLKVQPSGAARFVVRYLADGRVDSKSQREMKLGRHPVVSVATARAQAIRALANVTSGADPAKERKKHRDAPTLNSAFPLWLESLDVKASTLAEYQRQWRKYIQPALGDVPVHSVTDNDVQHLHDGMRATKAMADRVRSRLRTFFGWCEKPARALRLRHTNPTDSVEPYGDREVERYLHDQDIARLLQTLDAEKIPPASLLAQKKRGVSKKPRPSRAKPESRKYSMSNRPASRRAYTRHKPVGESRSMNPIAISAIRFLVFSGFRESEALSLRWDAIDFANKAVALRDTKTGDSRRSLADAALSILRAQTRVDGNPYVFVGQQPGSHLKEIRHVWYAVREHAKLGNTRLHDLRHTFASVMISGGATLPETGMALGHKDYKSTQRYAKLQDEPVQQAAERAVDRMLQLQRQNTSSPAATPEDGEG